MPPLLEVVPLAHFEYPDQLKDRQNYLGSPLYHKQNLNILLLLRTIFHLEIEDKHRRVWYNEPDNVHPEEDAHELSRFSELKVDDLTHRVLLIERDFLVDHHVSNLGVRDVYILLYFNIVVIVSIIFIEFIIKRNRF